MAKALGKGLRIPIEIIYIENGVICSRVDEEEDTDDAELLAEALNGQGGSEANKEHIAALVPEQNRWSCTASNNGFLEEAADLRIVHNSDCWFCFHC